MERSTRTRSRRRWWTWLGPLIPGVVLGCNTTHLDLRDPNADIPQGAVPAPLGTYVREFQKRQAARAEADDFVIYLYEWYKSGEKPGPFGAYHLDQIARRLAEVPFPVLIQTSQDPQLDLSRRTTVVTYLMNNGHPDADARVVVGYPYPGGLYGDEAERIFPQMLQAQSNNLFNSGFGRNQLSGFGQYGFGNFGFGGRGIGNFGFAPGFFR